MAMDSTNLAGGLSEADVERLVVGSRPTGGGWVRWGRLAPMVLIGLALGLLLIMPADASVGLQTVPLLLLMGTVGVGWWFGRRLRRVAGLHAQAIQAVQMGQWDRAEPALEQLLAGPLEPPGARVSALLALGRVADHRGLHDAVVAVYQEVLSSPADPAQHQWALAAQANSLLLAGRLTDANGLLDRLRTAPLIEPMATLAALAGTYRDVQTRNYAAAVEQADRLADRARRHLGFRAAYAYGLLALALAELGCDERAGRFYDCATRLMPPDRLAQRYPELAGLDRRLAPAESPL